MSDHAAVPRGDADRRLGDVTPELIETLADALEQGRIADVQAILADLSPPDVADVIEQLSSERRAQLVAAFKRRLDPEVLIELDEAVRDEVLAALGARDIAAAATMLDSDDAVGLIEDLEEPERNQVLAALPADDRREIEQALAYPEGSAGRMMQRELASVPQDWQVGQVIDHFREAAGRLPEFFYDVVAVDRAGRPVGMVALSLLVRTQRPVRVAEIMDTDIRVIPAATDQEEIAHLFRKEDLASAPVVDERGRLIGVITFDDVVDIIDEEAGEDMLSLAGAGHGGVYERVGQTVFTRSRWLAVNLVTALIASSVIAMFADSIQKIVALAILAPIVASMGGNAGTQTLVVAVRALAMKELTRANGLRFIGKEAAVALSNGALFAALIGCIAWLWFGDARIGAVIGAAMVANLLAAGLAGALIPLALTRLRVDPAVASGVFLTTVTDVIGFFAFLELATFFLL